MPRKAGTPCRNRACPGIVRDGVCSHCGPVRRQRDAAYNAKRPSSAAQGYGRTWQRVRAAFLAAHPLCADCEKIGRVTPATEVHHVVPVRDGGSASEDNLLALCKSCHSRRTARQGRGGEANSWLRECVERQRR